MNKKCISCRRTLPIEYFGVYRYRSDGYNPNCKECQVYRRKRLYRERVPRDADILNTPLAILPLQEHNLTLLESSLPTNKKYAKELRGTSLSDGSKYLIIMAKLDGMYSFEMRRMPLIENPEAEDKYYTVSEDFLKFVGSLLFSREIRLHLGENLDIMV